MINNELIKLECKSNIAILRLNRPEVHNCINDKAMEQFENHLDKIEADHKIRTIIITGTGSKTFCAGGDLHYFASLKTHDAVIAMSKRMQAIMERLMYGKRVVIGAVNGQSLGGGCEILTTCHFRIAASHATFGLRQAPNGLSTGWGGGRHLFKLIGRSAAFQMLLTGETIDVPEALRIGLINKSVEPDDLMRSAIDMADQINKNAQTSIEVFLKLAEKVEFENRKAVFEYETESFAELFMGNYFRNIVKKYE
ncbi:MAG: enoyl-CoA hydratase/isomerase family protein [Deltaproteobacteria bacterium]|nr:enoyl-CoA hydratase/isomerase family protein [Deltaproteobacteria bacterium]